MLGLEMVIHPTCYRYLCNLGSISRNNLHKIYDPNLRSQTMTRAPGRRGELSSAGSGPVPIPSANAKVNRRSAARRRRLVTLATLLLQTSGRRRPRSVLESPERIRVSANSPGPKSRLPTENEIARLYYHRPLLAGPLFGRDPALDSAEQSVRCPRCGGRRRRRGN